MTIPTPPARQRILNIDRLAGQVLRASLLILVFLILADYIFNYQNVSNEINMRRLWNPAREQSIPTWFSAMLAHALAITVFLIAWIQAPRQPRWATVLWVLTGLFFLFIGIDDFASIHEKLGRAVSNIARRNEIGMPSVILEDATFSFFALVAPLYAMCGMLILAFLGASFMKQGILHLLFLGFGLWAVSQSLDLVFGTEFLRANIPWIMETFNVEHKYGVTHTVKVTEESLEMLGTIVLWYGFLKYFTRVSDGFELRLESARTD